MQRSAKEVEAYSERYNKALDLVYNLLKSSKQNVVDRDAHYDNKIVLETELAVLHQNPSEQNAAIIQVKQTQLTEIAKKLEALETDKLQLIWELRVAQNNVDKIKNETKVQSAPTQSNRESISMKPKQSNEKSAVEKFKEMKKGIREKFTSFSSKAETRYAKASSFFFSRSNQHNNTKANIVAQEAKRIGELVKSLPNLKSRIEKESAETELLYFLSDKNGTAHTRTLLVNYKPTDNSLKENFWMKVAAISSEHADMVQSSNSENELVQSKELEAELSVRANPVRRSFK